MKRYGVLAPDGTELATIEAEGMPFVREVLEPTEEFHPSLYVDRVSHFVNIMDGGTRIGFINGGKLGLEESPSPAEYKIIWEPGDEFTTEFWLLRTYRLATR